MPNIGLLSNKVKVVGPSNAASDRYSYLDLKNAEPNFGVPVSDNGILASMSAGTRKYLYTSAGLAIDGLGNITVDEDTVAIDTSAFVNSASTTLAGVLADLDRNTGSISVDRINEYPSVTNGSPDVTLQSAYSESRLEVFLNGSRLNDDDWSLSGTTLTFSEDLDAVDSVHVIIHPIGVTKAHIVEFPTVTNGSADVTLSRIYRIEEISVYLNGIILKPSDDYSVSGTTLSFDQTLAVNDLVEVHIFRNVVIDRNDIEEYPTVVDGSPNVTMSKAFRYGEIDVYLNGSKIKQIDDYTISGTTLTFTQNLSSIDIVAIVSANRLDLILSDITDVDTAGISADKLIRFDGSAFVPTSMTEDSAGAVNMSSTLTVETAIDIKDIQTSSVSEVSYSTTSPSSITSFNGNDYSSGKLIVQVRDNVTGEMQVSQISFIHNTTVATTTEYSNLYTGSAPLASFDADIRGNFIHIDATSASSNSTTYKTLKTLIRFL